MKPRIPRGSVPSGIKYKESVPEISTSSISHVYGSCDCKTLQSEISKLKNENAALNEMLDSHMKLAKQSRSPKGGSKRLKKSASTRSRKYKHKYRRTRVRR